MRYPQHCQYVDSSPQSIQYEELLEVVTHAVAKLYINWPTEQQSKHSKSKLDERFLRSKPPPPHQGLLFFPDLHTEVSRLWGKPISARLFSPNITIYSNVEGLRSRGYGAMPWVEQTLAG